MRLGTARPERSSRRTRRSSRTGTSWCLASSREIEGVTVPSPAALLEGPFTALSDAVGARRVTARAVAEESLRRVKLAQEAFGAFLSTDPAKTLQEAGE